MQKISCDYPRNIDDSQEHISESLLQSLQAINSTFELNEEARIMSILSTQSPRILAQQQFTKNEWTLLSILLKSYPYYVSHEMLLASLTSLSVTDCHKRLEEAQQLGPKTVKRELKPVHRAISGIRAKLSRFCFPLKVTLVRDMGYVLIINSDADSERSKENIGLQIVR